jgi:SAM-dependent methyltransferase
VAGNSRSSAETHQPTSAYFRTCVEQLGNRGKFALDVPSGPGRHALYLAKLGWLVVAADIDHQSLRRLQIAQAGSPAARLVYLVQLDATRQLPFHPKSFDLAVVIHALSLDVLVQAKAMVRHGGHIIFETFGAQGGNWQALPRPLQVTEIVSDGFEALIYEERLVKRRPTVVTVRGLFRRRSA